MKILKAIGDDISFKYSGSVTIEITKDGVVVSDTVAQAALDRLAVIVEPAPDVEIVDVAPEEVPVAPIVPEETPIVPDVEPVAPEISEPVDSVPPAPDPEVINS